MWRPRYNVGCLLGVQRYLDALKHKHCVSIITIDSSTTIIISLLLFQYHGINVKSCYCDFDKHHRGFVTESQVLLNYYIS